MIRVQIKPHAKLNRQAHDPEYTTTLEDARRWDVIVELPGAPRPGDMIEIDGVTVTVEHVTWVVGDDCPVWLAVS